MTNENEPEAIVITDGLVNMCRQKQMQNEQKLKVQAQTLKLRTLSLV